MIHFVASRRGFKKKFLQFLYFFGFKLLSTFKIFNYNPSLTRKYITYKNIGEIISLTKKDGLKNRLLNTYLNDRYES